MKKLLILIAFFASFNVFATTTTISYGQMSQALTAFKLPSTFAPACTPGAAGFCQCFRSDENQFCSSCTDQTIYNAIVNTFGSGSFMKGAVALCKIYYADFGGSIGQCVAAMGSYFLNKPFPNTPPCFTP